MRELKKSNNEKFLIIVNYEKEQNDLIEVIVLETQNFQEVNRLYVRTEFGGSRFAISDDGKYIVTGKYSSKSIYMYDVKTGDEIYKKNRIGQVQRVDFSTDSNTIWVGIESGKLLLINVDTDSIVSKIEGERLLKNYRDDDLVILSKERVHIKEIRRKSSTFGFLTGCYTKLGLVMSEVRGELKFFDNTGKLQWCSNLMEGNHFILVTYDEKLGRIYGISRNYERKEKMNFYCFSEEYGHQLFTTSLERGSMVVLDYCKKIISLDGKIYKILEDCVELEYEKAFVV